MLVPTLHRGVDRCAPAHHAQTSGGVRAGGDGYCGWAQSLHLSARGYDVMIVDNLARRGYDTQLGMDTLTPIASVHDRVQTWAEVSGKEVKLEVGDVCDWEFLSQVPPRLCCSLPSVETRIKGCVPWPLYSATRHAAAAPCMSAPEHAATLRTCHASLTADGVSAEGSSAHACASGVNAHSARAVLLRRRGRRAAVCGRDAPRGGAGVPGV